MKISIKATNLTLTSAVKKLIEKKITALEKFIPFSKGPVMTFVEIALETRHHKKGKIYYAEVNMTIPGKMIRSEARKESIYQAISEVKQKVQLLLEKYKKRKSAARKKAGQRLKTKSRLSFLIKK